MLRKLTWIPDRPDPRDHAYASTAPSLPESVNLSGAYLYVYDQKSLGSCHDDETEVLTELGFKLFSELSGNERLATVNPETAELFFEKPIQLVAFYHNDNLICANRNSLNFRVTPNHKMLVRKWDENLRTLSDVYEFVDAEKLGWYSGLMNRIVWGGEEGNSDTYTIPGVVHKQKPQRVHKTVALKDWLHFLGFYLAEGTMIKRDERPGTIGYKIQLAAGTESKKVFIKSVLSNLGIHYLELPDRITFSNKQVYEHLSAMGLEGVKAGQKFVPPFVFKYGADYINYFLEGHFLGDGSFQYNNSHYTGSSQLANDLQLLIFLSGNESYIGIRPPRESVMSDGRIIKGNLPEHRVSVCKNKLLSITRKKDLYIDKYEGLVYCAEVPTYHTLVTRRAGAILVSGNCTSNAIAMAIDFERVRQGQKPLKPSRLFIYYNERSLEGTINSDAGAMIRDGIKTVSKQGACLEKTWPYTISKFKNKPSIKAYNEGASNLVKEYVRLNNSKLDDLKSALAEGFPFVFGFTVFESFESEVVAKTGEVEMPAKGEGVLGGHAVLAVGYDDAKRKFLVKNSWGSKWGAKGHFWIPYEYITNKDYADDFWIVKLV